MLRPAGRTPGEAAERDEIKRCPSRTESTSASQAFHLLVTPEPVYWAYTDLRAAGEAARAGLIDRRTSLKLALRAQERIRRAELERL